ncbi:host attachment family protein [Sphingomonas sp. M1-B02]|uniref:host attachment family protein n=1 Tax=Sphingomonas sp. M1-B02 TaxID=3114300 RepID=UPI00223FC511|nr:host attachment family protein [Sphingomonas sp. S6-11]UZK66557.1 host attachment family protein [Sphingomonas sp. S6-11]
MQVPHDAVVMVVDGRKMLFLRNAGDAEFPNLQVEDKEVQDNPKDSDQKTDTAGQASSTTMGTMGETDFHQQEEDRFAAEAAEMLKKRALNNDFESLIIVAAPRTLGELRKHYHVSVSQRLAGEISKDLTGHTVPQIEEALQKA